MDIDSVAKEGVRLDRDVLTTIFKPSDASAEAIRALRTHVMAQHVQRGHRALAVCAASKGVGCTYVAANLAVSMAQIGVQTLLIDANMRQPALDAVFHLPDTPEGLQQCLALPDESFNDFIEHDVVPGLSVIFAGGRAPDPQELLAGHRFDELMDFCLREFEATIIDTPPANLCADAQRISNIVSHSLIVARRNKSLVSDVKILAQQLRENHAQVIGTVLNEA